MRLVRIVAAVVSTVVAAAAVWGGGAKTSLPNLDSLFLLHLLIVFGARPASECLFINERAPERRTQRGLGRSRNQITNDQGGFWQGASVLRCCRRI